MSNARAKAERSKTKDIRQGIVEQKPVSSKNRKGSKPYRIIGDLWLWKDSCFGKYKNLADAEKALQSYLKKYPNNNMRIEHDGE